MNLLRNSLLPAMLVLIVVQFNFMPRYDRIGDEIAGNGAFTTGANDWKIDRGQGEILIEGGTATFINGDPESSTMISRSLPTPSQGTAVLVRLETLQDGVRGGKLVYQRARAYLVGMDSAGKRMWKNLHSVYLLDGTAGWEWQSKVIPVKNNMVNMVLGIGLENATGVMQARKLSLFSVSERPSFRYLSYFLLAMLVAVMLWRALALYRFKDRKPVILGVWIVGLAILAGVLAPGAFKGQLLNPVDGGLYVLLAPFTGLGGKIPGMGLDIPLEKFGHLFFFTLITIASRKGFPTVGPGFIAFQLMVFAATTETLQFYALERLPSFQDMAIDGAGILIGFAWVYFSAAAFRRPPT